MDHLWLITAIIFSYVVKEHHSLPLYPYIFILVFLFSMKRL
jgi:hypothetical protein